MLHIVERFFIHFTSSAFLTLAFYFALQYWGRRNNKVVKWTTQEFRPLLLISALLVFSTMILREPFDNTFGTQVWYKAITDQISWFLGAGVSVWGLYRFKVDKE